MSEKIFILILSLVPSLYCQTCIGLLESAKFNGYCMKAFKCDMKVAIKSDCINSSHVCCVSNKIDANSKMDESTLETEFEKISLSDTTETFESISIKMTGDPFNLTSIVKDESTLSQEKDSSVPSSTVEYLAYETSKKTSMSDSHITDHSNNLQTDTSTFLTSKKEVSSTVTTSVNQNDISSSTISSTLDTEFEKTSLSDKTETLESTSQKMTSDLFKLTSIVKDESTLSQEKVSTVTTSTVTTSVNQNDISRSTISSTLSTTNLTTPMTTITSSSYETSSNYENSTTIRNNSRRINISLNFLILILLPFLF
ncbi:unnamed protein product [Brachionus calyciflorus]|uniref:Uncharacterized protein n=1 Tax=Brachionus calyciflorus TaxID=104777 RepID=A0A814HAH0_9BILA|nr:unnamed protein product [Brachionus calyciflorus]